MTRILVVEDDERLNQIICKYLVQNRYQAIGCRNPVEAFDVIYTESIDLIISDIMMPQIDGFEFAQKVRGQDRRTPILFITALDDIMSKQKGFYAGVDDYMVKPLDMTELVLRVGALLRRTQLETDNRFEVGNVLLIKDEMSAYINGKEVAILPREFNILYKLLTHPKKIFTRSELLDEYWGMTSENGLRTVDVYITKLRKLFAECDIFEIVTAYGFGYKVVIKDES